MSRVEELREALRAGADPSVAEVSRRFFRTEPGGYGEGDRFLGVRVPGVRRVARLGRDLPVEDALRLLESPWHEERLLALFILVDRYRGGDETQRDRIHEGYLARRRFVNNWDLVDASAEHIVGAHLDPEKLETLEDLARSDSVWDRRIAMLATFVWTKRGRPEPALKIALLLLDDGHDLIHKAVGWMLREVGKRGPEAERSFLRDHYRRMPRTMLRYAIERFPEDERQRFLRGEI